MSLIIRVSSARTFASTAPRRLTSAYAPILLIAWAACISTSLESVGRTGMRIMRKCKFASAVRVAADCNTWSLLLLRLKLVPNKSGETEPSGTGTFLGGWWPGIKRAELGVWELVVVGPNGILEVVAVDLKELLDERLRLLERSRKQ